VVNVLIRMTDYDIAYLVLCGLITTRVTNVLI